MQQKRKKVRRMEKKGKVIDLKIIPKKGLKINSAWLLFGTSMKDIKRILGKANKIYTTDDDNIRWQYYDYFIELSFEKNDNYALGWIEVYNKSLEIFDQKFIGKNKDEVVEYFNSKVCEVPEYEDYHSFESIFYEKIWVELQFQFDKLYNINFGS